jgi:hypothetical protein
MVKKMLTPEHEETGMALTGHLIATADGGTDYLNNINTVSATKMYSERTTVR